MSERSMRPSEAWALSLLQDRDRLHGTTARWLSAADAALGTDYSPGTMRDALHALVERGVAERTPKGAPLQFALRRLPAYNPTTHRLVPKDGVVLERGLADRVVVHLNALQRRTAPICGQCGRTKAPVGRDVPPAAGELCTAGDCPSYMYGPDGPDLYWPEEVREDFARLRSALASEADTVEGEGEP